MSEDRLDQDFDLPAAKQANLEHIAVTDTKSQAAMFAVGQRAARSFDNRAFDAAGRDRAGKRAIITHRIWLPPWRGAEPDVRTTVASATPWPCSSQRAAMASTSDWWRGKTWNSFGSAPRAKGWLRR